MYASEVQVRMKLCFRPELFRNRILELNASDERGIQVSNLHVHYWMQKRSLVFGVKFLWVRSGRSRRKSRNSLAYRTQESCVKLCYAFLLFQ